ncbi:MAG: DUF2974 domain-containing protein [Clostridia bacterium]|nr:DUF2974 domain-containing protein [Clostridia bacterium]
MNNAKGIVLETANVQAILNAYAYVASEVDTAPNDTLGDIVHKLDSAVGKDSGNRDIVDKLKVAVNNDVNLKNLVLVDQVSEPDGMGAFAFSNGKGDVSVVFRGTGNGEWKTNGDGLSGIPEENTYITYGKDGEVMLTETIKEDYASDQQVKALNWFNKLASEQGWAEGHHITVSGHSAGGNKAQFITINSPCVDECYSFDGQGFSPEAIEMFKNRFGEEYEERLKKLNGFSASNDYVNVLGVRVIPEENINLLETPAVGNNVGAYHFMEQLINPQGRLNDFAKDYGDVSLYVQSLSDELMKLEPDIRQYVTAGVMKICQETLGEGAESVGGNVIGENLDIDIKETSAFATILGILVAAGPLTTEGIEFAEKKLESAGRDVVNTITRREDLHPVIEVGVSMVSMGMVSMAVRLVPLVKTGIFINNVTEIANLVVRLENKIKVVNAEIYNRIIGFSNFVSNGLQAWGRKTFSRGYQYATNNSFIELDTAKLRMYAERLNSVNQRLAKLDDRLNSLYFKVGLRDLLNLIKADLLTCESWRINNNIKYLNQTADDFDTVERNVSSQF